MLSSSFVLLSALVSATLAKPLGGSFQRKQADPPEGFTAAGLAPDDQTITFRIALAQRDFSGLEKALYAAATPGGAEYGRYLTKAQVNEYTAPSEEAVASVSSWLQSEGLTSLSLSPSGDWITVEATVGQANRLFEGEFTRYEAEGGDEPAIRTLSFTLPLAVEDHIAAVHPTTVFPPLRNQRSRSLKNITFTETEGSQASAGLTSGAKTTGIPPSCVRGEVDLPDGGWDPVEWTKPYSLSCRFDLYGIPYTTVDTPATDNSLWISGYDNDFANKNLTRDYLARWRPDLMDREMFDLVTITGGMNNQLPRGAGLFGTAGVSTAMSTVANTPVTFMSVGTDNSDDPLVWWIDQASYLLTLETPPRVLVGDWPLAEFYVDPAVASSLCHSYAQLAARGVTILFPVSSHGVGIEYEGSTCPQFYVTFPASCPYVTSVGGSGISQDKTSEEVNSWNNGGFSNHFSRPVYQDVAVSKYLDTMAEGTYEGLYNPSGRGIPDVSVHYTWAFDFGEAYGSESFSTYFLGAIMALLNEELLAAGKPSLGFLNPFIYQNQDAFNDFTTGNNPGCGTDGYNATTGWDPVSGVGSPAYQKLRKAAGL